jgi:hypothetical protein
MGVAAGLDVFRDQAVAWISEGTSHSVELLLLTSTCLPRTVLTCAVDKVLRLCSCAGAEARLIAVHHVDAVGIGATVGPVTAWFNARLHGKPLELQHAASVTGNASWQLVGHAPLHCRRCDPGVSLAVVRPVRK